MVASLVTSWRSLLRRSLTSRQSTMAPTRSRSASSGSTRTIRCASPLTSSVRRALRPDSTEPTESSTGSGPAGNSAAVSVGRCSSTRSPISPSRRYALSAFGLAYSTVARRVDPDEPVADPRAEGQVGDVLRAAGTPRR